MNFKILYFLIIWYLNSTQSQENVNLKFPEKFMFGAASSAYQIEGAWNVDGKGESVWDHYAHNHPDKIVGNATGDDAAKSYYKYKEDVKILKDMGMDVYRFSISWPRIMPTGLPNNINKKGIQYYNNLINELIENNIIPMVTIFHWDTPEYLQNLGGWTNEAIVKYFEEYARVLFQNFGDRVKWWITFNEPAFYALFYEIALNPPAEKNPGVGPYLVGHNILKAHSCAYHMYDKEFRANQNGKLSIAKEIFWPLPMDETSNDDKKNAELFNDFNNRWLMDPIFSKDGDYPQSMKDIIRKKSIAQGFKESRLPTFTKEEINSIRGSADFMGVNEYTALIVKKNEEEKVSFFSDMGVHGYISDSWVKSPSGVWLSIIPQSLRYVMKWVKDTYGDQWEIFITENGFADNGEINDDMRITYYGTYLAELLKAIHIDKIKVIGHTSWSLIDNLEWSNGYSMKFGLYHVDFNDPERRRTPKKSSKFMRSLIKTRKLPEKYLKDSQKFEDLMHTRGNLTMFV